jgi:hypothetical protein
MTQVVGDATLKKAVGQRLALLVDNHLRVNWDELATTLGYSTGSTLRQARLGKTMLSAEKLAGLARVTTADRTRRPSVDWLLTGRGTPLIEDAPEGSALSSVEFRVANSPPEVKLKIEAFLDIHGAS